MNLVRTLALVLALAAASLAFGSAAAAPPRTVTQPSAASTTEVNQQWITEGEKRYRINCGRCHQPPRTFRPRVMSIALRHMRVRGMLTEDDMRYVLYYMTH